YYRPILPLEAVLIIRFKIIVNANNNIAKAAVKVTFPSICVVKTDTPIVSFPTDQSNAERDISPKAGISTKKNALYMLGLSKGNIISIKDRARDAPDILLASSNEVSICPIAPDNVVNPRFMNLAI